MNFDKLIITRRTALRLGAGIAAGMMGASLQAFADKISDAKINGSSEMANGVKKDGKLRIGFSNGFSGNTWRTQNLASMNAEAAANADKYELITVDGQGDITKQVNDIDDLISQNVDVLLVIPNSGTAVIPGLRKANKAGILTIPFNLPVEGEDYTAFVGTDPKQKGEIFGKNLNAMLGGKGKIVAFFGLPGNSYSAGCWEGAQPQLGSGIEVLATKDGYWEEDKAKVIMADLIAAYPQIDGIYSDGAQMATGALRALKAAGRPLIPTTGDDYNGLLKFYEAEKPANAGLNIALVSEPSWEGVIALRTAQKLLAGESVPKKQIIVPTQIGVDNYKNYIKPDLPDGVFVDTILTDEELKKLFS